MHTLRIAGRVLGSVVFAAALITTSFTPPARAALITINVDPNGTTSNIITYGTVLTGSDATWPGKNQVQYRDYQFQLYTTSGTTTFDGLSVQLSANLRNQVSSSNSLRYSLWSGTIPSFPATGTTSIPSLPDSIMTGTSPNSQWRVTSSFDSGLITGTTFATAWQITPTPQPFFFRVWAEGNGPNNGYGTKMAATSLELKSIVLDGGGTDIQGDIYVPGDNQYFPMVVPEPSAWMIGASGMAFVAWRATRRRAAASTGKA